MIHQSFTEWLQVPVQGSILSSSPIAPADEAFLTEVLIDCQIRLKMALEAAKGYSRLPDLATALGDAVTACQEGLAVVQDPQKYIE